MAGFEVRVSSLIMCALLPSLAVYVEENIYFFIIADFFMAIRNKNEN